jgi:hypothetical protein
MFLDDVFENENKLLRDEWEKRIVSQEQGYIFHPKKIRKKIEMRIKEDMNGSYTSRKSRRR